MIVSGSATAATFAGTGVDPPCEALILDGSRCGIDTGLRG
jgi:hypothetical protein